MYGSCSPAACASTHGATAAAIAHQLVLRPRLAHADKLVALHGDIGEGDGALLHPQALELHVGVGEAAGGRVQAAVKGGPREPAGTALAHPMLCYHAVAASPAPPGACKSLLATTERRDRFFAIPRPDQAAGHSHSAARAARWAPRGPP